MLPTLWFCLVAITITGYVLLDGFDLGAGILQMFATRTEAETSQVLRSISNSAVTWIALSDSNSGALYSA
jgi:cytochrome bd-type quinol oxidase subunit 2